MVYIFVLLRFNTYVDRIRTHIFGDRNILWHIIIRLFLRSMSSCLPTCLYLVACNQRWPSSQLPGTVFPGTTLMFHELIRRGSGIGTRYVYDTYREGGWLGKRSLYKKPYSLGSSYSRCTDKVDSIRFCGT